MLRGDILPGDETPKEACNIWSTFFGENTLVLIGESMLCCCWNWLRTADLCDGEKTPGDAAESEYLGEEASSAANRSSRFAGVSVLDRAERFNESEPGRVCE
ncbi:hypothetical protein HanXRQr2_Chr01g0026131 [Helianthus annuus]|uniref:Uncharacterized protein n=1 Tax=Helianthus annuus TaxID=4232 RepID=A0A9K3JW47_HELAN|nr:hypothetical protein HanXRQr2_Chr01g0026131 [Helianthus annuus]KAJ0957268.1 hypothetical protein HanPSC8_Chr01g0025241 [Helianthus annuus]